MVDILGIQRVSVSAAGVATNADLMASGFSADGSKVFFYGAASNLLSSGTSSAQDVFMKDLVTGEVTIVSKNAAGVVGNNAEIYAAVSGDGNTVVFRSASTNLLPTIDNGVATDIYVKNLVTGEIAIASITASGVMGDTSSGGTSPLVGVSYDGTKIAFETSAMNLVPGDTGLVRDIVVKNMVTGALTTVSQSAAGALGDGHSINPQISADGTKVIFQSIARNLLSGTDTNGASSDIFLKDLATGAVSLVSTNAAGLQATGNSITARFSQDATKVVFVSNAKLSTADTNTMQDIYIKNLVTGQTTLVSTSGTGATQNDGNSYGAVFSPDGKKVAFLSEATHLVENDTNGAADVFVKDLTDGSIIRVNTSALGVQANYFATALYFSPDGSKLMFSSAATNLIDGQTDTLPYQDVFVVTLTGNKQVVMGADTLHVDAGAELTNVSATLLANDVDPENQAFSITSISDLGTQGHVVYNATTKEVSYTADSAGMVRLGQGQTVNDTFSYTVTDAAGNMTTQTVTVVVAGKNDAPLAHADAVNTQEDTAIIINKADLLANDTDVDNGAVLSFTGVATSTAHGTLVDNGDGTLTYTPAENYNGTDGFTYTMTDEHGATSSSTVTFDVASENDAPVGNADAIDVTVGDTASNLVAMVLTNDSDVEGDALSVSAVAAGAAKGDVLFNAATQSLSYTATSSAFAELAQGEHGTDSFTYTVRDANGATHTAQVTVNVTGINDAPVANADTLVTDEDISLVISKSALLGNDTDADHGAVLNFVDVSSAVEHGTLVDNGDGTFTYTANANYHGADGFSYVVTDEFGATATASVAIDVVSVNDVPVAANDTLTTDEDTAIIISKASLLANDTDADSDAALSIANISVNPEHGTLVDNNDGTYTYTPVANYNGVDGFSYVVTDELGATSTATVAITVNSVDDAPVAADDTVSASEDSPQVISIASMLANDSDLDAEAVLSFSSIAVAPTHGALVDNGDGTLTYMADANYHGSDAFSYVITDEFGATTTAGVAIDVVSVNDVPVAVDDAAVTDEDAALVISKASLLANDTDADSDAVLSVAGIAVNPEHGTLTDNGDGTYTYLADANYNGSDSLTYTLTDEFGATSTATLALTVNAVNDAPVAQDDAYTTNEDVSLVISVASLLANDADVDAGAVVSFNGITSTTTNGTLTDNGNGTLTYTYTPTADFNGGDSFTYAIVDEHGLTSSATASITVEAVNDVPVAGNDTVSVNEDEGVTITKASLLANDSDADRGTILSIASLAVSVAHGTLIDNGDSYTYHADANYNGVDAFTYVLSDGEGGVANGTVDITVNAVNDLPVAQDESITINEDAVRTITFASVLANDADVDTTDTLTVDSVVTGPTHGALTATDAGWIYTPTKDYFGDDSFVYRIADGHGGFADATYTITLLPMGETIEGSRAADTLTASVDDDVVNGYQANDLMYGLAGKDTMNAGTGNDTVYGDDGDDYLLGASGDDSLLGGEGNDRLSGYSEKDMLLGGNGVDTLDGGSEDDTLYGGAGNDRLLGSDGNDSLFGEDGDDNVTGGLGNDVASGGNGVDTLRGEGGNDTVAGGADGDRLYGDAGNDSVAGDDGDDRLYGDVGNDTLNGGSGNDLLYGEADNDLLLGGIGSDRMYGDAGNDTLDAGVGKDYLTGGDGADVFRFTSLLDSTSVERDLIYDYVDGADKIDVHGLGFTGVSSGKVGATDLKIQYSAAADLTYIKDMKSDFIVAMSGNHLSELDNSDFIF